MLPVLQGAQSIQKKESTVFHHFIPSNSRDKDHILITQKGKLRQKGIWVVCKAIKVA
jgi:hypothetical protein